MTGGEPTGDGLHSKQRGALCVAVRGIGLLGPGLSGWPNAAVLLREPSQRLLQPTQVPPPGRLPPTERRRAGAVVKASIVVADEACAAAGLDPAQLATVFTSSTGDPLNCHLLCEALATTERMVSPTRFTNSVHNAAAGYWHIATQSRQPSTSLAAYDASFSAGLLEAAVQCLSSGEPVLLVACDVPYPEPLHTVRPVADVFAVALVIAPWRAPADGPGLLIEAAGDAPPDVCSDAGLEALRRGIPAARALPLLQVLAAAFELASGPAAGSARPGDGAACVLEGQPGQSLRVQRSA